MHGKDHGPTARPPAGAGTLDIDRDIDTLAQRLAPFRLVLSPEIKDRIRRYCEELVSWNRRYALLSRRDVENVVRKHVAASLGALLLVDHDPASRWVDVGSGAGLPGMVLKIWAPAQPITLIDGSRRKSAFLETIARELHLSGVEILTLRVETLVARGERLGSFDVLFARAVADLTMTLREFGPLLIPGGQIITFKGPYWREDVAAAAESGLLVEERYGLEQVIEIPWTSGHILQIRKAG